MLPEKRILAGVIPTFNRRRLLQAMLEDISKCKIPENIQFEIIVVIDGSIDGTREMLQENFPDVHFIVTTDLWYTKSINEGFKKALELNAEFILALNDDIKLPLDYLENILSAYFVTGCDCIIGSLSLTASKPFRIASGGVKRMSRSTMKLVNYFDHNEVATPKRLTGLFPSVMVPGRGMLIPQKILKELNLFDPGFLQYHSDFDFCLRARKAGFKCFISYDAKIYTYIGETSPSTSFMKKSLRELISHFGNKYSRIYLPSIARYIYRHGIKILWPVTFLIFIVATLKANLIKTN
jgi:GT2 family glycosyltransferase